MAKFEDLYGNTKDDELLATIDNDGLMSKEDKIKLNGIDDNVIIKVSAEKPTPIEGKTILWIQEE